MDKLKCVGGIIGDIVGKPYEFHPVKEKNFPWMNGIERYTDDSVMTIAVMDWLANGRDLVESMQEWGRLNLTAGYGPGFKSWILSDNPKPYNSFGNGSAMRVSPVGWMFDNFEKTLEYARKSAEVTHNHPEGIMGAQAVAGSIWLARNGRTKDEIKNFCTEKFGYDLERGVDQIRKNYHFEVSCQKSVPEAIICFLQGTSYEDVVRNAISLGGDADTQACIAGSIAEAFGYDIPNILYARVERKLTTVMLEVLKQFNEKIK